MKRGTYDLPSCVFLCCACSGLTGTAGLVPPFCFILIHPLFCHCLVSLSRFPDLHSMNMPASVHGSTSLRTFRWSWRRLKRRSTKILSSFSSQQPLAFLLRVAVHFSDGLNKALPTALPKSFGIRRTQAHTAPESPHSGGA